jgi:hypothetical protein
MHLTNGTVQVKLIKLFKIHFINFKKISAQLLGPPKDSLMSIDAGRYIA